MGCATSTIVPGDDFVVEFLSLRNIPHADLTSPSDPCIQATICSLKEGDEKKRIVRSRTVRTVTKIDCDDAYFNTYRNLQCTPQSEDVLYVEIFDVDDLSRNDRLGSVTIPISSLTEQETTYHVNREKFPDFTISLRRAFINDAAPTRKQFFLVRHGESKWNLAQREVKMSKMAAFDHGLTARGVMQALRLNKRWKRALPECFVDSNTQLSSADSNSNTSTPNTTTTTTGSSKDDTTVDSADAPYFPYLRRADIAYSSPLTRAVQTALCCLWNHKSIAQTSNSAIDGKGSLILRGNIREVKNVAGFDTVGKVHGSEIGTRVSAEFRSVWSQVDVENCENVDATQENSVLEAAPEGVDTTNNDLFEEDPVSDPEDKGADGAGVVSQENAVITVISTEDQPENTAIVPPEATTDASATTSTTDSPCPVSTTESLPADLASVTAVQLHHYDVNSPWWTPPRTFDSADNIKERVLDTLDNIRYGPAEVPVLVGHSLFWRALYGTVCSHAREFMEAKPQLSANMKKYKLDNGVMMFLDVDFASGAPVIMDAHLMFGGGFHP